MAKRTKAAWPLSGFSNFAEGVSRLVSDMSSFDKKLASGLEGAKQDLQRAELSAHEGGADFLRRAFKEEEGSSEEGNDGGSTGSIDMSKAKEIVQAAMTQTDKAHAMDLDKVYEVGKKALAYKWGGNSPEQGLDCSGLCTWAYKKVLGKHPFGSGRPTTRTMITKGRKVLGERPSVKDLKDKPLPGDLVFMEPGNTHHVGMCIGDGTGKFIHAPRTGDVVKVSELAGRQKTISAIRRYLPEDSYETSGTTGPGEGVDVLDGYTLPTKSGYCGSEEEVNSTGHIVRNGKAISGRITFGDHCKLGKEYQDYYLAMRWNYIECSWNPADGYRNVDEKQISWMKKKPRMVLVTNTRNGKQAYCVASEYGPAPWTGTKGGKANPENWPRARKGNPSGYKGRSAGLPPVARKYLDVKQQVHGAGGDVLTFQWAKDQNVKPGPVKAAPKTTTASTTTSRNAMA